MGPLAEHLVQRLVKGYGEAVAKQMVSRAYRDCGVDLEDEPTPKQQLAIADTLSREGGAAMMVGHTLRIRALLRGAQR